MKHPKRLQTSERVSLPPPAQLAQIAAALAGPGNDDDRFRKATLEAVRLYLRAERFHREHRNDCLADLRVACGEPDAGLDRIYSDLEKIAKPSDLPKPKRYPARLEDFFRLIVEAREPDRHLRLRRFLTEHLSKHPVYTGETILSPDEGHKRAIKTIEDIRAQDKAGGYFTEESWLALGSAYRSWWRDEKSQKASESAKKRKSAS